MTEQEVKQAIEVFKDKKSEYVEWDFPQFMCEHFDTAIKCMETVQKIPEVLEWLEYQAENEKNISENQQDDSGVWFHRGMYRFAENMIDIIKEKLGV